MDDVNEARTIGVFPKTADPAMVSHVSRLWNLLGREKVVVFTVFVLITVVFHYEVVFLNRTIVPLIVPGVMPHGAYPTSGVTTHLQPSVAASRKASRGSVNLPARWQTTSGSA